MFIVAAAAAAASVTTNAIREDVVKMAPFLSFLFKWDSFECDQS